MGHLSFDENVLISSLNSMSDYSVRVAIDKKKCRLICPIEFIHKLSNKLYNALQPHL